MLSSRSWLLLGPDCLATSSRMLERSMTDMRAHHTRA